MRQAGDIVMIARPAPHRALVPALLAALIGGIIATAWAVTASRNIRTTLRTVPAQFAPVAKAVAEAKTDVGVRAAPIRQVVEAVSADLKAREDARAALGQTIKAELSEQP